MFEDLFSSVKATAMQGLNRIVEAKAEEQVARIERKTDQLADTVRGATVSPVEGGVLVRGDDVTQTAQGAGWSTGMVIAAVVAAALILRRL